MKPNAVSPDSGDRRNFARAIHWAEGAGLCACTGRGTRSADRAVSGQALDLLARVAERSQAVALMRECDLVVICSPAYHGLVLGLVKNAIDYSEDMNRAGRGATAEAAIALFVDKYAVKYLKAVHSLTKDRDTLLTFFDFPAEHWDHLHTSDPVESIFATVRHRSMRTKESLHKAARPRVFKLVMSAAKTWRRLKESVAKVADGATDGVADSTTPNHLAA